MSFQQKRFHTGKVRYESLRNSRYKSITYGKDAFVQGEDENLKKPAHGTYGALLFDQRWITKRAEILLRDNHQCVICSRQENLQVHHRQYHYVKALEQFKAPWDYDNNLMITLCEQCHSRGHDKFKVPNVYI